MFYIKITNLFIKYNINSLNKLINIIKYMVRILYINRYYHLIINFIYKLSSNNLNISINDYYNRDIILIYYNYGYLLLKVSYISIDIDIFIININSYKFYYLLIHSLIHGLLYDHQVFNDLFIHEWYIYNLVNKLIY